MKLKLIALIGIAATMTFTSLAEAETRNFSNPKIGQHRLDWCLTWGKQCGQPAARAWCRQRGYAKATRWRQAADIGLQRPTKVLRGGQICNQAFCDGFAQISCAKAPRLISVKACQDIGNRTGSKPPTCIGEQGRNFGKAGSTFHKGDPVWILMRLRGLDRGSHQLRTSVRRTSGGKTTSSASWNQSLSFSNQQEAWWFWFQSKAREAGSWTEHLSVDNTRVGRVHYCVNCALE